MRWRRRPQPRHVRWCKPDNSKNKPEKGGFALQPRYAKPPLSRNPKQVAHRGDFAKKINRRTRLDLHAARLTTCVRRCSFTRKPSLRTNDPSRKNIPTALASSHNLSLMHSPDTDIRQRRTCRTQMENPKASRTLPDTGCRNVLEPSCRRQNRRKSQTLPYSHIRGTRQSQRRRIHSSSISKICRIPDTTHEP